ncbi:RTA1 like protein-domain-containing protein [Dactylonectria macrodidyma]|uniref:RTA1 like protein-domain-containing protein n=1 Tax=Dactylonectria macrodidyma TaxID=307937 RepID=A0A9P9E5V9_9HYPO|nr:RTA1 like protein-domain-containing protein [Dactylonectria macrodidyma]
MARAEPYSGDNSWRCVPLAVAAGVFCALFFLTTTAHSWRIWRTRAWFCIPFLVGGCMQFIGYACRAAAQNRTTELPLFVVQQTAILLAPVAFDAAIHLTLSRVIRNTNGEGHTIISRSWLRAILVLGDGICLVVQAIAAGLIVTKRTTKPGQVMGIVGLALQVAIFGGFISTTVLFHKSMLRDPRTSHVPESLKWQRDLWMLYGVSCLVVVRSIFRITEFALGTNSYLSSHEWSLYAFDSAPMLSVMIVFSIWFPTTAKRPQSWLKQKKDESIHVSSPLATFNTAATWATSSSPVMSLDEPMNT